MGVFAEVFFRDLEFENERRLGHRAEERRERLARLEVERAVLHLNHHVVAKLSVERREFVVRLLHAVGRNVVAIDERAPDDDAAVRTHGVGEHVGAVGVRTLVVLRTRLSFRVRFDEETAEVGNRGVDLVGLGLPPRAYRGIERIGRLQSADLDRRAEARREVHVNAVRTKDAGERRDLLQVLGRQRLGVCVDVRERHAVDADRRFGARIVAIARRDRIGKRGPFPQRRSAVAVLDAAIEVVPVVDQTELNARRGGHVESREWHRLLESRQQRERSVQNADVAVRGDHDHALTAHRHRAQQQIPRRRAAGARRRAPATSRRLSCSAYRR